MTRPSQALVALCLALVALCLGALGCSSSHGASDGGDAAPQDGSMDGDSVAVDGSTDGDAPDSGLPAPATAWSPPFAVDERDDGLCTTFPGRVAETDIWAHAGRVYVVVDTHNEAPGWPSGSALHVHDGEGWRTWHRREHPAGTQGDSRVVGLKGPSVWLWGGDCRLRRIDGPGEAACAVTSAPAGVGELVDVHMIGERRGWALAHATRLGRDAPAVGEIDGEELVRTKALSAPDDYEPLAVWGDPVGWFALDRTGLFASSISGGHGRRRDVPAGPYAAMWATSRDDLWVSTQAGGLLHFDGLRWATRASIRVSASHLWSQSEQRLYYGSARSFGVWAPEDGVERLLSWSAPELTLEAIDGDESAVYLLFTDRRHSAEKCGDVFVVEHDGESFRRL